MTVIPKQVTYFFEGIHDKFRPDNVPENWLVFNAARPLEGSKLPGEDGRLKTAQWTSEFHNGVFYAAVDPEDAFADTWIRQNNNLDAYLCHWVTKKQVYDWIGLYYTTHYNLKQLLEDIGTTWDEQFEEHYQNHCQLYSDWARTFRRSYVTGE